MGSPITFSAPEVAAYFRLRVPLLRQHRRRWRTKCPLHGGTHDSFSVNPETGLWRCWSNCGPGDIIKLEIALTGASWRDAVREIEHVIGRQLLERPANRAERRAIAQRCERDQRDGQDAEFWRIAAESIVEKILEELPEVLPQRFGPTQFLLSLRAAHGGALLALYRDYYAFDSRFAEALVFAGKRAWQRRCDALARFIAAGAEVSDAA